MSDDIVTRLRRLAGAMSEARFPALEATAVEAADAIQRLRNEREEARHGESVAIATLQGVIEERTTLSAERDEARRRFCEYAIQHGTTYRRTPQEVAGMMGWDCFKETMK